MKRLQAEAEQAEPSETYVCILTSASRGALAVISIWGVGAIAIADTVFRPARGSRLARGPWDRPRFGRVGKGAGDEVVALVCHANPPEVEFHCHGGPAPVEMVLQAVLKSGARLCMAQDWLNYKAGNSLIAEALADLASAPTLRTAEILLDQAQGALVRDLVGVVRLLILESPAGLPILQDLIDRGEVGTRLIRGWSIALAGRPNVGKSRLLNALAGYERAIVDPTPGTTRDVLSVRTAFEGWPVELFDTAGIRESPEPVEAAGIAMARAQQASSDLTMLILDRSEPLTSADRALIQSNATTLIVANKTDLPAAWEPWDQQIVCISAERADGLDQLGKEIVKCLVREVPGQGVGVPFRPAHLVALNKARAAAIDARWGDASTVIRSLFDFNS